MHDFKKSWINEGSHLIRCFTKVPTLLLQTTGAKRIHRAELFRLRVQTWYKSLVGIHNFQSLNCLLLGQRLSLIRDDTTFTLWIPRLLTVVNSNALHFLFHVERKTHQLSCTIVTEQGYWQRGYMFIPITQSLLITADLIEVLWWKRTM